MKALLYKEFRLAMHPICYVFVFAFPLMVLIPSFPTAVCFIYILSAYPILFLGANKGQQSNDLLYSTLLPVRKKDIVLARIFTVLFMQIASMLLVAALSPLAMFLSQNVTQKANVGLTINGFVSVLAFAIVGYALADLIFFPIYYHHGRSIVLSTLLMILGFVIYLAVFTVIIPSIPMFLDYKTFFCDSGLGVQFAVLGVAIALSAVLHFVVYKLASKQLEKVDF